MKIANKVLIESKLGKYVYDGKWHGSIAAIVDYLTNNCCSESTSQGNPVLYAAKKSIPVLNGKMSFEYTEASDDKVVY